MSDPQLLAAQPELSASVRANAGSGKTWTLIARVARLLLAGARPQTILCVTYTKAAAAEMQRRLFATLGDWAVMENDKLTGELARFGAVTDDLSKARRLFASALETPGGLKIQTIHAFCEQLLRRFPLEAGVAPTFEVLDDVTAAELAQAARRDLALNAVRDGRLGEAYDRMAVRCDLRTFDGMLTAFVHRRRRLRELADRGWLADAVWNAVGLGGPVDDHEVMEVALAELSIETIRLAAGLLAASGQTTDGECAVALHLVLEHHRNGTLTFDLAIAAFATAKGEPRKHYATSRTLAARAEIHSALLDIRDTLFRARADLKAAEIARDSLAAMTLGLAYAELYEAAKRVHGGLDFDDLIARARDLLTVSDGAAWVLYKLDSGLNHILLDEAQDTADAQWDILRALSDEFFAGAGLGNRQDRTIFFVGDEKQSIYGFNGAAPERLASESASYGGLVAAAGRVFRPIDLLTSRRSTPQVLGFVDAVSNLPAVRRGLTPGGPGDQPIVHGRLRDDPGCVELWPMEAADDAEAIDPWLPVDAEPAQSANKKLARRLAAEIARLIAAGEGGAGDVMILVRRRKALFEEIIRALKQKGVPVAGADRLKLSAHIAFQDLIGLARFCLFPGDDLTLAALLRSPFCAVDEDSLLELAKIETRPGPGEAKGLPGRKGRLWDELAARAHERADWTEALAFLSRCRGLAQRLAPFDFYGRVLNRLDGAGRSVRARMLTRLGPEAADVIDAFLGEAQKAEQGGARSFEAFVAALSATELEIKREKDEASGVVRVMTIHGAKGLEAPIVFLPDTTTCAKAAPDPLFDLDDAFLWAPRADDDCPATDQARGRRKQLTAEETQRLLYVAMTRAADRLVICGVELGNRKAGLEDGSWYDLVTQAFDALPAATADLGGMTIRRFGPAPTARKMAPAVAGQPASPPAWLAAPPPREPAGLRYVSPSSLADHAADEAASPLTRTGGLGRFRRGDLIHRLLQLLPDIAAPGRRTAAETLLAREPDLTADQRAEMIEAAFGVLEDPRFSAVFAAGSRAEVAVAGRAAGLPPGMAVGGRLDRLIVEKDRVLVVDFKTNRPSPARIEDADPAYITQMAAYAAVLAEAFPGRRIEAALVWTDGPKLMAVPENMLEAALARLGGTP